jgi:hypothetical protein
MHNRFFSAAALLLLFVLAVFPTSGQTPLTPATATPSASTLTDLSGLQNNFAGVGFGFQSVGNPQTSGWAEACHRNPDVTLLGLSLPSYACAATDYAPAATSARVDVDTVILHRGGFFAGTKTGAGAAVGSAGVGASYALGGWGAVDVSKFLKLDGLYLVASSTWQKDDIAVATQAGTLSQTLRTLTSRATFRFGFEKGW